MGPAVQARGIPPPPPPPRSRQVRGLWPHLLVLERGHLPLDALLATRPDRSLEARDWRMTRLLVRQLAAGLGACHAAGFVHGSFWPGHLVRVGDSYGGCWKARVPLWSRALRPSHGPGPASPALAACCL